MKTAYFRWSAAILILAAIGRHYSSTTTPINIFISWTIMIFSALGTIVSAVLIFPDTGLKLVHGLGDIASGIFFPRATEARPPLSYRLAHYYVADGLFEKAAAEYQRILHYYPEEKDAYQELIEVALRLNNQGMVEKWRTEYRHRFHEQPLPVGQTA